MRHTNIHDSELLARQIALQEKHAWDLEQDIPWQLGIDLNKYFLPLDADAVAFPNASAEQRLALSQWMGLVVNATISEMEDALPKLKQAGWMRLLNSYPANPELVQLGELFFEEEEKHARAFRRYLDTFCQAVGIEYGELTALLPQAFGSYFQKAITKNAEAGGHAFWWIVAAVEEVSINIFQVLQSNKQHIDPLYFDLHRKHLEEEARHANYAFLMLDLAKHQPLSLQQRLHQKIDFAVSQIVGTPWVLSELHKFFKVAKLKHKHPFFEVLASCIPLFENQPKHRVIQNIFVTAPYISWFLNANHRKKHLEKARDHNALKIPFPKTDATSIRLLKI